MNDWCVVIPAGGTVPDDLASVLGTQVKALAPVCGKTSVEWTLAAVHTAGFTNVAVIGSPEVGHLVGDAWVPEAAGQIENAEAGVAKFPGCDKVLFLPADTPLMTSAGILDFVSKVEAKLDGAERWFSAGLCTVDEFQAEFPGFQTDFIRLKGQNVMSGALFATSRAGFHHCADLFRSLSRNRKNQFRMLLRLGPVPLVKYFTRQFTLADGERTLGRILGGQAVIVTGCEPAAMADIDTAADYAHVLRHAEGRLTSPSDKT